MRNTEMFQRILGKQNAVCHRNLDSSKAKYGSQGNSGIQNAICHMNLERCNAKCGNVSEEFRITECSLSQEF
jgi:hypothetical protein